VLVDGPLGERFQWWAAVRNGADGVASERNYYARLVFNAVGTGAFGKNEGAYGYEGKTNLSFGAAVSEDEGISDGTRIFGEAGATWSAWSFYGDVVRYDDDYDLSSGLDPDASPIPLADTTPYTLTLSHLFFGDRLELAGRYEDFDDDDDTHRASLGLNYYMVGHDAKWQLSVTEQDSDVDGLEGTLLELGLSLKV
jgi:hypothetical protein